MFGQTINHGTWTTFLPWGELALLDVQVNSAIASQHSAPFQCHCLRSRLIFKSRFHWNCEHANTKLKLIEPTCRSKLNCSCRGGGSEHADQCSPVTIRAWTERGTCTESTFIPSHPSQSTALFLKHKVAHSLNKTESIRWIQRTNSNQKLFIETYYPIWNKETGWFLSTINFLWINTLCQIQIPSQGESRKNLCKIEIFYL